MLPSSAATFCTIYPGICIWPNMTVYNSQLKDRFWNLDNSDVQPALVTTPSSIEQLRYVGTALYCYFNRLANLK
jgi:hypothetical protein